MIFTLNGIRDSAAGTTDRMATALEARSQEVTRLRYPVVRGWNARSRRSRRLRSIQLLRHIVEVKHPRHIVAHSNGCAEVASILDMGGHCVFDTIVFFAPALDRSWVFQEKAFRRLYVVSNPRDQAIFAAGVLGFDHPWGTMGRKGYEGTDPRVTNIQSRYRGRGVHGHYFIDPHISEWANRVIKWTKPKESNQ